MFMSDKFSWMTSTSWLEVSGGTASLRLHGEKGVTAFSPAGQVVEPLAWQPPLFQLSLVGSDRCVKPCGQMESRGLTLSGLFFCWQALISMGSDKNDGLSRRGRKWKSASKREQMWSVTSSLLFPLCNQRDIAGGKLWELSCQQALRRAAGITGWQRNPCPGTRDVLS